ncbi:alpha subunit of pyruvate dehydrogenase [Dimargaris verticillata]|uniref:Pyruvate dehydrogenase E1 component subunit alpha n=1 Tax=Dimargaris verticillata TaxID=2761393 RepID=A0A9W8B390_9FUNG|nr:alpha subunit of pyruvate dehydrogenase [Dimargaris verticillata]
MLRSLLVSAPGLRLAATRVVANPAKVTRLLSTTAARFTGKGDDEMFSFTLPEYSFEAVNVETPSLEVQLSRKQLLSIYEQMTEVRRLEMSADGLYKAKMIRGFCHLCTGQEAVPVGIENGITKNDSVITAYRCHGFTHMRGGTVTSIIAELMGRKDGISHGMGGSMHMFAHNFYGGNGIVGAQVPIGAGIALTHKYLKEDAVCFSLYGDGAANQGQVFEAFNMAKLWNLPCIFVCENNKYGMGTSSRRSSANTEYFKRGDYIPGIKVHGMDAMAVLQATRFARKWALDGNGPLILEMATYRYGGHSMSDPGTTYRSREEVQHMRSTDDPITGLKHNLIQNNVIDEAGLKKIDKEARARVDKAVQEAKRSPEPPVGDLWTNIYVKGTEPPFLRGRESGEVHHFQ